MLVLHSYHDHIHTYRPPGQYTSRRKTDLFREIFDVCGLGAIYFNIFPPLKLATTSDLSYVEFLCLGPIRGFYGEGHDFTGEKLSTTKKTLVKLLAPRITRSTCDEEEENRKGQATTAAITATTTATATETAATATAGYSTAAAAVVLRTQENSSEGVPEGRGTYAPAS